MKDMTFLASRDKCIGCGACASICSNGALSMADCEKGFLYPVYNSSKCGRCNLCSEHCHALTQSVDRNVLMEPNIYAAWSMNEKTRYESSSGGIFTELARCILLQDGVVVGATLNSNLFVEHILIERENDIELLRKSKYTQSNTLHIFEQVRALIKSERIVMFSGTPCQCAAISAYLGNDCSNILLCDLVCHGVNSNLAYKKYFDWLRNKFNSDIKQVSFRDKRNGWQHFGVRIIFENGKEYFSRHKTDPFIQGFLAALFLRACCKQCHHKGKKRPVDITLGDFWGITLDCEKEIEKGISLVMIHTKKGENLFLSIANSIYAEKRSFEECVKKNPMIVESAYSNTKEDLFFSEINDFDFDILVSAYKGFKMKS